MANQKTALMLHRQFFVYFSVIPLIVSVSYFEILRFLSVTEIYIKMSDILIIWLSALVSQMAPYLIFILLQKSTHSVNMVLYSQNARLCRNCALIRPTILGLLEEQFGTDRAIQYKYSTFSLGFFCSSTGLIRDNPYWTSRKNSLELI